MTQRLFLFLLISLSVLGRAAGEVDPKAVLAGADAARGNMDGVHWQVEVMEAGDEGSRRLLSVQAMGFDMVADTLEPPKQKGHKLLLLQNNMWFYKPGLSKPVPVSLRQKLTGRASNGDIASTNYAEDYEILSFKSTEYDGQPCYLFKLQAVSRNVTYARVDYWVEQSRGVGVRADYFNTSGEKRIKTARMRYDNTVQSGAGPRVFISEMVIVDELASDGRTILQFSEPELKPVSPRMFNLQALGR
ncbi:outer membrane lipoprotein-sorting protein [Coraliomargarita parva]|uniref:outer membrane lipoprotein-sorting protein n=1 Tax=Coraliomargarita parva TaxID=3014050 RepID=UPI0022B4597C|nr:outer membrane lipoprotein-sorting protein [Coraliomargarita parva]